MKPLQVIKRAYQLFDSYLTIWIFYLIPLLIYCYGKYGMYDFELDPYIAAVFPVFCTAMPLFTFHSAVRLVLLYSKPLQERFDGTHPRRFGEKLRFLLRIPSLWVGAAIFALLHILIPSTGLLMPLTDLVPGAAQRTALQAVLVAGWLLLFALITLKAAFSAMRWWQSRENARVIDPKEKKKDTRDSALYKAVVIYGVGGILLCNMIPLILSLFPLLKELLLTPFTVFLLALVILLPLAWRPIRALHIRRTFLQNLQAVCRERGIEITAIDRPYLTVFRITDSESFFVTVKGVRYACKLVGNIKKSAPMGLFSGGVGAIVHNYRFARVTLFSRVTQFEYGFASDDPKILIINPVPKAIYRSENGRRVELDNGDVVDGYKIYTATGFLGAVERETLDR